jgi:hypothetical protein
MAEAVEQAELWKLIGRDNPAGRALHALYNGSSGGQAAGLRFTQVKAAAWRFPAHCSRFHDPALAHLGAGKQSAARADAFDGMAANASGTG